jgi:hypothetical protein
LPAGAVLALSAAQPVALQQLPSNARPRELSSVSERGGTLSVTSTNFTLRGAGHVTCARST